MLKNTISEHFLQSLVQAQRYGSAWWEKEGRGGTAALKYLWDSEREFPSEEVADKPPGRPGCGDEAARAVEQSLLCWQGREQRLSPRE